METLIEIDLASADEGCTAMTFTQSRFNTDEVAQAYEGDWPSCFEKLQKTLGLPGQQKYKNKN